MWIYLYSVSLYYLQYVFLLVNYDKVFRIETSGKKTMFQSSRDHFQVVYIYKYLCAFKVSSAWQLFHIECDRLT